MNQLGQHSKILHYLLLDLPPPDSPRECLELLFDDQDIEPYQKICPKNIIDGNPTANERHFVEKYTYLNAASVKPARHLLREAINRGYTIDTTLNDQERSSKQGTVDQIFYQTLIQVRKEAKLLRSPTFIATPKTSSLKSADLRIVYSLTPLDPLGLHERITRCVRYMRF